MFTTPTRVRLIRATVVRNRGMVALIAICLVLLAAIIAFFHALYARQNSAAASVREDALWATYQTERETGRLILALIEHINGRGGIDLAEVSRRFDILYSRHEVMEEADFAGKFLSDARLRSLSDEVSRQLHELLPTFDGFAAERRADPVDLALALARVRALQSVTEELLIATNHVQLEIQVDDRDAISAIYAWLAGAVSALVLATGAVVLMIWRQMKQIEVSRYRLQRVGEELAASAAAAEAGNKAKSAFLATMSHEIRTPLNGIIGTAELMGGGDLDLEQREQLDTIRQCSDALIALINDILDFSKLESGQIDLERRAVALPDVVDGVVEMSSPRAEAKGLNLLACYPMASYETDPARLRQVLLNLVGNAVKFTDDGVVVVRVREMIDFDGGKRLRFEVEDTGVGISRAAIDRLFVEFSQADASIVRRFGGTGLGLAISKRIVEAMNGRIGVHSVEGKGTTFWFEVPVGRVDGVIVDGAIHVRGVRACGMAASPIVRASISLDLRRLGAEVMPEWRQVASNGLTFVDVATWSEREAHDLTLRPEDTVVFGFGARAVAGEVGAVVEGAMTTRRIARVLAQRIEGTLASEASDATRRQGTDRRFAGHVLVVEDNPVNRKVAVGMLTRLGVTCETVVDGQQALDRLAAGGFDAVLMDMQMPVMDGLAATAAIRREAGPSQAVPIIGLTANAFVSDRAACFEAGMNDFLAKPVTRVRLAAALAAFLPTVEASGADHAAPQTAIDAGAVVEPATSEPAEDETPVLDLRHRTHLAEEIGEDGLAEVTGLFFEDAVQLTNEMTTAYEARDVAGMRRVLHTLTGAAANVGLSGVSAAIAAVRAADYVDCPDEFARLGAALLAARTALVVEDDAPMAACA